MYNFINSMNNNQQFNNFKRINIKPNNITTTTKICKRYFIISSSIQFVKYISIFYTNIF